jgi:hypothetical protein
MTAGGIKDYLKQHWPAIREQLLNGTYEPKPVRRVEIPKPDGGGVRKLGAALGISPGPRLSLWGFRMRTSNRWDFLHCSRSVSLTTRTAVYGPVRTVVWQGSAGDRRPYADQTRLRPEIFPLGRLVVPYEWIPPAFHGLCMDRAPRELGVVSA